MGGKDVNRCGGEDDGAGGARLGGRLFDDALGADDDRRTDLHGALVGIEGRPPEGKQLTSPQPGVHLQLQQRGKVPIAGAPRRIEEADDIGGCGHRRRRGVVGALPLPLPRPLRRVVLKPAPAHGLLQG